MTNYIEVTHIYLNSNEDRTEECRWAVRPTPDKWFEGPDGELILTPFYGGWDIEPSNHKVTIYEQSDIDGLRKLLDAIEVEINKKENN